MSAIETIRMAEASGIRLEVEGPDLILDADFEPPVDVVNAIARDKAEIIELLAPPGDRWTTEDWRAFFDERAAIAEFDGGQSKADAEVLAFECCVVEWLIRHPECSAPGRCAWCGAPDRDEHAVVPFWTKCNGPHLVASGVLDSVVRRPTGKGANTSRGHGTESLSGRRRDAQLSRQFQVKRGRMMGGFGSEHRTGFGRPKRAYKSRQPLHGSFLGFEPLCGAAALCSIVYEIFQRVSYFWWFSS